MKRLRRMLISFCVVLNLASFGLLFLVLANGASDGEILVIASGDAVLLFVASVFGLVFNVLLAILLWRGSLRTRRLEAELREEALYPPE